MSPDFTEIVQLLKSNQELLKENNVILKKMQRSAAIAFWFRVVWFCVVLGLPLILYFSFIKPYLDHSSGFNDFLEQNLEPYLRLEQTVEELKASHAEQLEQMQSYSTSTAPVE